MTQGRIDLEQLRSELRGLSRGNLLIIAERATEIVSHEQLSTLLADFLPIGTPVDAITDAPPLLDAAEKFRADSMAGRYYESFRADSRSFAEMSRGTDAFTAEFDRLLRRCMRAVETGPEPETRRAFEVLFGLLRHIDEAHDDVIFLADDVGASQVGVNWRIALPAYFRCLAQTTAAEEFARTVSQTIAERADYERPFYLKAAHGVANAAQQAALDTLSEAKP